VTDLVPFALPAAFDIVDEILLTRLKLYY